MSMNELAQRAVGEVGDVLQASLPAQIEAMAPPILTARRIVLHGVGREGLMIKSLAMRLFHLGLDAHMVGDMTTPHVGSGDLLIVSAGPGEFGTVSALVERAKGAEAATMCITAEPSGNVPGMVDTVIHLPAQTMARDQSGAGSVLPMGSLFEAAQFMFFEILILHLRDAAGISADAMRARHTNME
ncbi:MAG: 6-phospho-3-hexuloisomerase [Paracoccaceae bacterium]|nr:6-phospho-3-hexuloisomerase [Paracoccaceae bacterium]